MFSILRKIARRIAFSLNRAQHEQDLAEEIEEHRRMRGAASVPSPILHLEASRAVWIPPRITSFVQDFRYGARQLRHNRMFTLVALSGLAIAIGLNTAVFSVVDAIFWRPLPVKAGDRTVHLIRFGRDGRRGPAFSEAELRHYQESGALESVTGFALDDGLFPEWPVATTPRVVAAFVAPNFFEMLGATVIAGAVPQGDETGPFVLVTETAWKRRLLRNREAIGAKLALNGFPFTIAGIIADKSVAITDPSVEIVLPLRFAGLLRLEDAKNRLSLIGRLQEGTGTDEAQTALGVAAQRWSAAHPEDLLIYRMLPVPARLAVVPPNRAAGTQNLDVLLVFAVLLAMLIACANLTNLLLARAEARRSEMAIRLSLGAGRFRLVRQLLTECFLLTAMAGVLGLLAANGILRLALALLPRIIPDGVPVPWLDLGINGAVFAFTLSLCAVTTVIFGLVPAIEATRPAVASGIKGASTGSGWGSRVRGLLIATQMAACVVLLVVTASLHGGMTILDDFLSAMDFRPVIQAQFHASDTAYSPEAHGLFLEKARERTLAVPGVEAVAITQWPMARALAGGRGEELEIAGRSGRLPAPAMRGVVSDGCLRVFGLQLAEGRDFTSAESRQAAPVVLINEPMARDLFPSSAPVGQRIRYWSNGIAEPWQEIIGVIAEKPIAGASPASHAVLRPLGAVRSGYVQVRVRGDRAAAMLSIAELMRELGPGNSTSVNSLQSIVDFARWGPRAVALASLLVALASLWMAAIGLYGVTSFIASRRTREIGVRMALGAQPGDVLRMMLRQGAALVAAGTVLGSLFAAAADRVLTSASPLLPPRTFHTYAGVAAFLAAVALLAMSAPSLRATRVNPVVALRHDG